MKNKTFLPAYSGGSIVNLTSSLRAMFGADSMYPLLEGFDIAPFKEKDILFMVIDGLGYDLLMKQNDTCFLKSHTLKKITSVFPSSTASAFTSIATGVAPQQHGLTGWFMFLRETGVLTSILPFITKAGGNPLKNISFSEICAQDSIFKGMDALSYMFLNKEYINSQCSEMISKGAKRKPYSDIKEFIRRIENALNFGAKRKFMFAYWDMLDKVSHDKGVGSPETIEHLIMLDSEIKKLASMLDKKNTALIICSDHGMIDTSEDVTVNISDHPDLSETLAVPLSGEPRVAYCYVRPGMVKQFENYVTDNLAEYCSVHPSHELIEKGYFGLYEPHKKLQHRIGDYTLITKKNYMIRELLSGEKYHGFTGMHGSLSHEEMFVPLIVYNEGGV